MVIFVQSEKFFLVAKCHISILRCLKNGPSPASRVVNCDLRHSFLWSRVVFSLSESRKNIFSSGFWLLTRNNVFFRGLENMYFRPVLSMQKFGFASNVHLNPFGAILIFLDLGKSQFLVTSSKKYKKNASLPATL